MQKQRAFIQASSSSIPYLHQRSGEMPERERVSKAQRFYRDLGVVGGAMVVALADWLGKGQSPTAQVAGRGLNRKFEPVSGKLLKGRRRGLRFEREFLSAVFPERGPYREHSHSRWRTQNKTESAGLGPLFHLNIVGKI